MIQPDHKVTTTLT